MRFDQVSGARQDQMAERVEEEDSLAENNFLAAIVKTAKYLEALSCFFLSEPIKKTHAAHRGMKRCQKQR
jgi:hypothetical protein